MAAAAEILATGYDRDLTHEEYAHSLSTIRRLGNVAIEASADAEQKAALEWLALSDFTTAVTEMLKTDEEFRQLLDVDNTSTHRIEDGTARAADGTPMVTLVGGGLKSSRKAAQLRPELHGQVVRDEMDVENARHVDELQPGMTRIVVSMDPKEDLKNYEQAYRKLGYREGLAYIQYYCRVDDRTLISGSYSVDRSDLTVWRELYADLGVIIPDDESPNGWIQHALEIEATASQAAALAASIRNDYYKRIGASEPRSSISDYVKSNNRLVKQYFYNYYPALASALNSGNNNELLQSFARALLQTNTKYLKPEVIRGLMRIGNLRSFDNESGKLVDSVLRYAVVEELRKGLKRPKNPMPQAEIAAARISPVVLQTPLNYMMNPAEMHYRLAGNVESGARAQRSYGGCAGQIELGVPDNGGSIENNANPQEAYGGRANAYSSQEDSESKACEYQGTFCYCCPYENDGSTAGVLKVVTIRRGSDGVASCLRAGCGAALDSKGKVINHGGIYERAMRRLKLPPSKHNELNYKYG
jgi:hypothetical protein